MATSEPSNGVTNPVPCEKAVETIEVKQIKETEEVKETDQTLKRPASKVRYPTAKQKREHFEAKKLARQQEEYKPREGVEKDPNYVRLPKRKVALLMGFCGSGYQGMQMNPNAKTIEGDLFKALVEAGAISKDNADDPSKVSFMRAARTDKGVSAAGQVVSLKCIVDIENLLSKINQGLPDQIRVFGYIRTLRSFHAKTNCESRIYEYLLPSYVFIPPNPSRVIPEDTSEPLPPATDEELQLRSSYRIPSETLAKLREALGMYVGSKNFHNFTIGRSFGEQACTRTIKSFTASEPFVKNGVEWISCKVQGQSFMLHQIRKMIALVVMLIRTNTPLEVINKAFEENKVNVPKAPGLGLLLEQPMFGGYNKKLASKDFENPPLDFTTVQAEMDQFREKYIYPTIFQEDQVDQVFPAFLNSVDFFPHYFGYLNPTGTLPPPLARGSAGANPTGSDLEDHADDG